VNSKEYNRQYYLSHKEQIERRRHAWLKDNPDKPRASSKKSRAKIKLELVTHYGNGVPACVKCGFSDIRALSIDHIDGGGTRHMQYNNIKSLIYWLKKHGFPSGYQTLCMNCQFIKKVENNEQNKR
jgi:hypothetical protein